ncbi:MAG: hypothetical protein A4E71_00289 [Smithella sp. PtaU1.Bin162]|nr:MAG: hypothetical protein A4E71_00289 [Smithella sp. PtaU1.Bin162]
MYLKDLASGMNLIISNILVLVVVLRGLPLCVFKK